MPLPGTPADPASTSANSPNPVELAPETSTPRYPVPVAPPTYESSGHKIPGHKRRSLADILEFTFVVVASALTLWLAYLLLLKSTAWTLSALGWLVVLWALMAYLALPKLHQFFTSLYVPDYFISRTRTGDGLLGDPVNLALDGSAADIHAAMRAAGWHQADEITLASAWGIIKSSVFRKSYPEAPVSDLFLFNQRHAFAYQQEVDGNAAQRHHIRFWPVPEGWVLPGGHHVTWLAAGTYDRAVGLSLFTGQITHKIDANIDLERDYVINTVRYADPLCTVRVIEEFSTAYHHRNGGGDSVTTDGDLPVLDVTGAAKRARERALAASPTAKGTQTNASSPALKASAKEHVAPQSAPTPNCTDSWTEAIEEVKKRRIPPLPFLIVGLVVGLTSLLLLAGWIAILTTGDMSIVSTPDEAADFMGASILMFLIAVCWVLTIRRHPWARLLLAAVACVGALQDLLGATVDGVLTTSGLISAAVSVLILWAVCGESMSRWVEGK